MATRRTGRTSQGIVRSMAGALAAIVLCGSAAASPLAAYNTFHGVLHQQVSGELAGTFSGSFHYDLTDDIGGPGGRGDGLPDHMASDCTSSADLAGQGCIYTPLAVFGSRYFTDFSLVLLDGTRANVRLPIDRIEVVNHDLGDYLVMHMVTMQLTWEPFEYFDSALLAGALARLPAMQPPAGTPVPYAGIEYSVYFNDVGPLSVPEPTSPALVGIGMLMALGARRRRPRSRGAISGGS